MGSLRDKVTRQAQLHSRVKLCLEDKLNEGIIDYLDVCEDLINHSFSFSVIQLELFLNTKNFF